MMKLDELVGLLMLTTTPKTKNFSQAKKISKSRRRSKKVIFQQNKRLTKNRVGGREVAIFIRFAGILIVGCSLNSLDDIETKRQAIRIFFG